MSAVGTAEILACRSCGEPIFFAVTPRGKSMPLDAEPTADGTVRVVDGVAHVTGTSAPAPRYIPHWSTCSDAERWRGRK